MLVAFTEVTFDNGGEYSYSNIFVDADKIYYDFDDELIVIRGRNIAYAAPYEISAYNRLFEYLLQNNKNHIDLCDIKLFVDTHKYRHTDKYKELLDYSKEYLFF